MSRIFISALGTSFYEPVAYASPDADPSRCTEVVRYVQEARLRSLHSDECPIEHVWIVRTETSAAKNWLEAVPPRPDAKDEPPARHDAMGSEGLQQRLQHLGFVEAARGSRNAPTFDSILVKEPKSEDTVWQIFQQLADAVREGDEVHVDITHGFRIIPQLMTNAVDFACRVRGATLASVTYGAFEARDRVTGVAPTFDLTPLLRLRDWTTAFAQLEGGDLRAIAKLTESTAREVGSKLRQDTPAPIKQLAKPLRQLADSIIEVQLRALPDASNNATIAVKRVVDHLEDGISEFSPVRLVLERVGKTLDGTLASETAFRAPSVAVAWARHCADSGLYLQAVVLLREAAVEAIAEAGGLRFAVADGVFGALSAMGGGKSLRAGEAKQAILRLGLNKEPQLQQWCNSVGTLRNSLMHGHLGIQDPRAARGAGATEEQPRGAAQQYKPENVLRWCVEFKTIVLPALRNPVVDATPAVEEIAPRLLVLMSHQLTQAQVEGAREQLGVQPDNILSAPTSLIANWSHVSPDGDALDSTLECAVGEWLDTAARPNDYLLVHGEPGHQTAVVLRAHRLGLRPIYATTHRDVVEEHGPDGAVTKRSVFRHVRFKPYPGAGGVSQEV